MAKPKINAGKFKEIFTSRFEILGLVVACVLVVLCVLWGISNYLGAHSPEEEIKTDIKKLNDKQARAERPGKIIEPKQLSEWPIVTEKDARLYTNPDLFISVGGGPGKRVSPLILGMDKDNFQMDYLLKGVCMYDVLGVQEKMTVFSGGNVAANTPVIVLGRERFVVVSGTFSYKEQVENFKKALLMDSEQDMFLTGFAPTFDGLIVDRRKLLKKDNKDAFGDWEPLYSHDPNTGKVVVHNKDVETLLQTAVYDYHEVDLYRDVIHGMSVMPMPRLMGGNYPEIKLKGIADAKQKSALPDPKEKKGVPKPADRSHFGPTRPSVVIKPVTSDETTTVEFEKLSDQLRNQLKGKINYFSPYGTFATVEDYLVNPADAKDPTQQPNPDVKTDGPMSRYTERARQKPPVNEKALVRFIDVNVEPGNTYEYRVRLRFSNPNFGQLPKFLLNSSMSRQRELYSDWVTTPTIEIPGNADFRCFITNQDKNFVSRVPGAKGIDKLPAASIRDTHVPFQVHKFVNTQDQDGKKYFVADWVVAERLHVARGEQIGRDCEVEVTHWNKKRMQWDVVPDQKKGGKALTVDFRSDPPVVLLDFTGGNQSYKVGKGNPITEESGTEALLLMPDMTMVLRTSREDLDEQVNDAARLRREVHESWKQRIEDLRSGAKTPDKR